MIITFQDLVKPEKFFVRMKNSERNVYDLLNAGYALKGFNPGGQYIYIFPFIKVVSFKQPQE